MRKSLLFLTFITLVSSGSYAQTFALVNKNYGTPASYSSFTRDADDEVRLHLCNETKAGFIITGLGIITGGVGIAEYDANKDGKRGDRRDRDAKIGEGMWLVGGVIAIMGSVLAIDGGARDMHNYYKVRRVIIISEGKSVGFAYNFR